MGVRNMKFEIVGHEKPEDAVVKVGLQHSASGVELYAIGPDGEEHSIAILMKDDGRLYLSIDAAQVPGLALRSVGKAGKLRVIQAYTVDGNL
jgi:hypothetical protein